MTTITELRSSKELFINLTLRELRSKYKRSFLGWAWSTLNPLAMMAVYTIVFTLFFKISPALKTGHPSGLRVYALLLLCGLLPWNFFMSSVMGSMGSLIGNAGLIQKTYFPRQLLPAATVAANLVSHLIEMGLLIVALVAFGDWRAVAFLPLALALTLVTATFALGLGLLVSALNVYFRDIEHFMGIFFLVWLYLTPIIYPIGLVPARFQFFIKLNPMTDMVLSYRYALYNGTWPDVFQLAYFVVFALGILFVGMMVFNRLEKGMAEEL